MIASARLLLCSFALLGCSGPVGTPRDGGTTTLPDGRTAAPDARAPLDGGTPVTSGLPDDFFFRTNGALYIYPRESSIRFADIRANIDSGFYAAHGVNYL